MAKENRWYQISITCLLLLPIAIGTLFAGYRSGFEDQRNLEKQKLDEAQRMEYDKESEFAELMGTGTRTSGQYN